MSKRTLDQCIDDSNDNAKKRKLNAEKHSFDISGFTMTHGNTLKNDDFKQQNDNHTNNDKDAKDDNHNDNDTETNDNKSKFSSFSGLGFAKLNKVESTDNSPAKWKGWGENKENGKKNDNKSDKSGPFKLHFDWSKSDFKFRIPANVDFSKDDGDKDDNVEQFVTAKPVAVLAGEALDTGDSKDTIQFQCIVKVFSFDQTQKKWTEKGKGDVNVNTYTEIQQNTDNNENSNNETTNQKQETDETTSIKGRLLCRREKTMQTLLNLPITKDMKYEIVSDTYVRIQTIEKEEEKCVPNTFLIKPVSRANLTPIVDAIKKVITIVTDSEQ